MFTQNKILFYCLVHVSNVVISLWRLVFGCVCDIVLFLCIKLHNSHYICYKKGKGENSRGHISDYVNSF